MHLSRDPRNAAYGVVAYSLARRTSEPVVTRCSDSARCRPAKSHPVLVFLGTRRILVVGGAVGVAGAFASTHFVSNLLYGVKATDGVVFLGPYRC